MINPYLILNVPLTATDAQIRAAWQRAVQEHPPERDALRFQEVQEAWQALRDARARAAWAVRPREAPAASPADALLLYATRQKNMTPPGATAFRAFLQACSQPPPHHDGTRSRL
jgi:curved DNA-binding protein CbpA